jgi:hypothetical protein
MFLTHSGTLAAGYWGSCNKVGIAEANILFHRPLLSHLIHIE